MQIWHQQLPREKQQQVTQAKALAQTRQGAHVGRFGVFFLPLFCLACAASIYFYSEVLKTGRHGGEEPGLPPLCTQPLLTLREAQAAPRLLSRPPGMALAWRPPCEVSVPRRGRGSCHSRSVDG